MGIDSHITDSATKTKAQVIKSEVGDCRALVVATVPYREFENKILFFSNDDVGVDMNVDAGFSGTPEHIHDGTDNAYWTATDIVGGGKTTFNSADQNHTVAGALSIKVDNSPVGDVFQIAKGSDLNMTGYVALSLWVYVDKNWKVGDSIQLYGWDTDTDTQVGTTVLLQNYFQFETYDIWHKVVIPLTDFGDLSASTVLDAIRVRIDTAEGKSPKFYLDDIQFEEIGTPVLFCLKADKGTWLHVKEFTVSMADDVAGTLADATMPYIAYDKFLGESLIVGVNYQWIQNGKSLFSQTIKSTIGWLQLPGTSIVSSGSDGTNTWFTMRVEHIDPLVLKHENDDMLCFTVADNLSGLLHLRITAGCKMEKR